MQECIKLNLLIVLRATYCKRGTLERTVRCLGLHGLPVVAASVQLVVPRGPAHHIVCVCVCVHAGLRSNREVIMHRYYVGILMLSLALPLRQKPGCAYQTAVCSGFSVPGLWYKVGAHATVPEA